MRIHTVGTGQSAFKVHVLSTKERSYKRAYLISVLLTVQRRAKEWALGCANSPLPRPGGVRRRDGDQKKIYCYSNFYSANDSIIDEKLENTVETSWYRFDLFQRMGFLCQTCLCTWFTHRDMKLNVPSYKLCTVLTPSSRFNLQNMFSAIVTIMMCCSGPLSLLKAQGLLLMSLVVIVVNLINLGCIL